VGERGKRRKGDAPMHDVVLVKEGEGGGELCNVKTDGVFWKGA